MPDAPHGLRIAVILPAAGAGRRLGGGRDHQTLRSPTRSGSAWGGGGKAELELAGRAMWAWAAGAFAARGARGAGVEGGEVVRVVVAVSPDDVAGFRERHADEVERLGVHIIAGGRAERWETVLRALEHLPQGITHVAVHDAARPLVTAGLIDRCFAALAEHDAVVPGVAVTDTLKRVEGVDGVEGEPQRVVSTPDRRGLVAVQTPQCFEARLLRRAYARVARGEVDVSRVTDDASLVEAMGEQVYVVAGERWNMKVTLPGDVEVAAGILRGR